MNVNIDPQIHHPPTAVSFSQKKTTCTLQAFSKTSQSAYLCFGFQRPCYLLASQVSQNPIDWDKNALGRGGLKTYWKKGQKKRGKEKHVSSSSSSSLTSACVTRDFLHWLAPSGIFSAFQVFPTSNKQKQPRTNKKYFNWRSHCSHPNQEKTSRQTDPLLLRQDRDALRRAVHGIWIPCRCCGTLGLET